MHFLFPFVYLYGFFGENISGDAHRCRNKGGTDVNWCGRQFNPTGQIGIVCGRRKLIYRHCHISALNGPSNGPYYTFTPYAFFTADSAHTACAEVRGSLPDLKTQIDALFLQASIEFLLQFVILEWPWSLRLMTWPVSIHAFIPESNS